MDADFIEQKMIEEITNEALKKRELLVQSCRFQVFNRASKDLDLSIRELFELVDKTLIARNSESLKKVFKNIGKLKSEAMELEKSLCHLEGTASKFENENHFAKVNAKETARKLREDWEALMNLLNLKLIDVQRELDSSHFIQKCEVILDWIQSVKNNQWNPDNNRILFEEMRKYSVLWNEVKQIFHDFEMPKNEENKIFKKLELEWQGLENFVDSISKEMDEHERILQFVENVDDIEKWIDDKEKEMKEKYLEMDLEESMKYRKTIEIEIETTRRRVKDADKKRDTFMMENDGNGKDLKEKVEKIENRFKKFEEYMEKWKIDVENKADLETFLHEADDILYWCSEKMEDLKNMKQKDSMDCDEIAVWVETNNFDFESWDHVVESFFKNGQTLLEKGIEKESVEVNAFLEDKIKTIFLERVIYQTHSKASHLVSVLKNDWKTETSEQTEKILLMNDGLALRCASVVEQIENIEKEPNIEKLSPTASELVSDLSIMKDILKNTCSDKKNFLTQKLDVFYLFDNSNELKEHTESILHSLKTEIHRETKLKNSKNRVDPLYEQLENTEKTYELLKNIMKRSDWGKQMDNIIKENLEKIRKNIEELIVEQDAQLDEYDVKKELDETSNFVERVERWIDESIKKLNNEDETDSPIKWNNLKQKIALCKQLLSINNGYKNSVENRKKSFKKTLTNDEAMYLIDGIEDSLQAFGKDLEQKIKESEEMLIDSEQINELNSQNDWIKLKIDNLSDEPFCDSLLAAQKLSRRYENESEEIENRRKNINDVIADVKRNDTISRIFTQIIEDIERNWSKMKRMFDERGGYLEVILKLFEYDEESVNVWEWIREKMMFVDSVEKKEEEDINRYFVKKLEDTRTEVVNFQPKVLNLHKLLDDAFIQSNGDVNSNNSAQLNRFKNDLTRKQREIDSDYAALMRSIERKSKDLIQFVQESEIHRDIQDVEKWIESNEKVLNRIIAKDGNIDEINQDIENKLDDVDLNLNRKRANLTEMKCQLVRDGSIPANIQKIDEAFSTLDVFAFEVERMRQKTKRTQILKYLRNEFDDIIGDIQVICERFEVPTRINQPTESEIEILRKRVLGCFEKSKEIKANNADLAPKIYDLEEKLDKEWNKLAKLVDERRKQAENAKLLAEIESELIDLEHWFDSFNEEINIMTSGIHDSLGVQIAIESVCTWKEELVQRNNQLNNVNNLMRELEKPDEHLNRRRDQIELELEEAARTINSKHEYLIDFLEIIHAERNIDRMQSWIVTKRRILNDDNNNSQNPNNIVRKMSEIEKMLNNRKAEFEELKDFVRLLRNKPDSLERTEVEEKFENLAEEWRQLEDDLKKKEFDFNESMSQLLVDEEYDKVNGWIESKFEIIKQTEQNDQNIEKQQKHFDTIFTEIREFQPIYEDFLKNELIDPERVSKIVTVWTKLVETVTVRKRFLENKAERNRVFQNLNSILEWFYDSIEDVEGMNAENMYRQNDCDKLLRKLEAIYETANVKYGDVRNIRQFVSNNSKIFENDIEKINEIMEDVTNKKDLLIELVKDKEEDFECWKDMQNIVKSIDDEICWFKELSVIISSSDVGQNLEILKNNNRTHVRLLNEMERRKSKTIPIIDRAMELLSYKSRPALIHKIDEIDEKVGQMQKLIENIGQLAEIRTERFDKWKDFFELFEDVKEKERIMEEIEKLLTRNDGNNEKLLVEIEENLRLLDGMQKDIGDLKRNAEKMSSDEMLRTKGAENSVSKLISTWNDLKNKLNIKRKSIEENVEHSKFLWKCDTTLQCLEDQKIRISNLIRQKRPASNFENAQYHSTVTFIQKYQIDVIESLIESADLLKQQKGRQERELHLKNVLNKVTNLQEELDFLAKKIENDLERKQRIEKLQDEFSRKASELSNWIEQAQEDIADIVGFETEESTNECMNILVQIADEMKNEKVQILSDLELIEVELSENNEDVRCFTWHSYEKLSIYFDKLVITVRERTKIVENEMIRHSENSKICKEAAELLKKCKDVLNSTKKELNRLSNVSLDDQYKNVLFLIEKLNGSGMIEELEHLRNLMESRYIFVNRFTQLTPNGLLVDICHCLDLMGSMLRSVEQSIADRENNGVTEKQLREFEQSFDYFDKTHDGSLDYNTFELCLKSQGYEFVITEQTIETMTVLDPSRSGKIMKNDYMKWMVKNETTNVFDDKVAIEDALKSLDAKKLTDSMSRKEAEFFLSRIPQNTQTITEHVHLEYKDFIKSFY
ncbi:unnamed protein product [Caenorhabditis angaria]|uniref:EF-hand domain-containing protein n=1 Tax=Caenorhabditis angaria TaxID=860376 RepID=A0A9P1MYA3_9PELO|nr:unnamed protein product [Caenorhabditis angaria]